MKLLRHLLAHQWSSLKLAHFGWLVLLAVHFLLRFTEGFEEVLPVRKWDFPMHPESLTMVLWGMACIILLAQEDAIAKPTAFWITKPPSFGSLWLAKSIIIFAIYLLLPLMVEMLIWWKLDFGPWIPRMVVQWSITQLSWILPSMVVGMLARTFPQSLLWFGALVAGVALSTFIASLCGIQLLPNPHGQTPEAAQTLVFYQIIWQTLLAAICLVVFLITKRHSFGKVFTLASVIAFGFIKTLGPSPEMDRWLSMRDNTNLAKEGTFAVLGASYGGSSSSGGIITSKSVGFELGWLEGNERPDWVRLIPKISTPATRWYQFYPTGASEGSLVYKPTAYFDPQTLNANPVLPFRIEMGQTLEIFRRELPVKTGASWVDGPSRCEIRSVTHVTGDVLVEIYTRVPFFAYPDWNLETAAPYLIHLPTQQRWRLYRAKDLEHGQPARYLWETNVTYSVEGWGLSGDKSSPPDKIAAKTYLKEDSPWLSECKLVWVASTEAPWKPQDTSIETSRILSSRP